LADQAPGSIVLGCGSRSDAELLARAQWDQASPGIVFDKLSARVRHSAIEQAGRLIRQLAATQGVTTIPDEEQLKAS
jgi:hypothetical protein